MENMRDFKSDIKNKLYTNNDGISSMIPYHSHGINYALDLKAEPLLRAYFVSAIIAYINRKEGLKFDDIINTVDLEDFSDEKSCSYYENLREMVLEEAYTISQIIKNYSLWGLNDKNKSNPFFTIFTTCMHRLQVTFKAAVSLLNSGFFIEVIPIYRLILEQLAFGAFLLIETNPEKIKVNQVQKNISHLKTALNNEYIGKFYNYLSSEAHLEPKEIGKYTLIDINEKSLSVKNRSGIECDKETGNLLFLLEIYGKIVWKGLNYFGFTTPGEDYFRDWYKSHRTSTSFLRIYLKEVEQ